MKAINWIDKLKSVKHWESDYRIAKELGLSRNTISNFRCGRNQTMDDETAAKVAHAMGENPVAIIIDQVAERSKNPEIRASLLNVSISLCTLC
jgi:transcriptional regulator with XRE-family HTH domain